MISSTNSKKRFSIQHPCEVGGGPRASQETDTMSDMLLEPHTSCQ